LKDKKSLRDKRPKLGKLLLEEEKVKEKEVQFNDSENEDDEGEELSALGKRNLDDGDVDDEKEVKFTDEGTTAMFGGEVSVTVDTNIADQLDDASHVFSSSTSSQLKKPPTALEKAMKKAKNIMHLKIINKNKHLHIKKGDDKKDAGGKGGARGGGGKATGGKQGGGKGGGKGGAKKSRK
jgi:hypothetical protein